MGSSKISQRNINLNIIIPMSKSNQEVKRDTFPGINPKAKIDILSNEEKRIVTKLAKKYWYVTNVIPISSAKSVYRVVFLKPVDYITQNFNLKREIVRFFSPYSGF